MRKEEAAQALLRFLEAHRIGVLNVAGPRASGWPAGEGFARGVLGTVLERHRYAR
jgi:Circularly permutated YpsA SLOG family